MQMGKPIEVKHWISTFVQQYPAVTVGELLLPATHDSYSYKANPYKVNTDDAGLDKYKCLLGVPVVSCIAQGWTVCTRHTIYEQLVRGVRIISIDVTKYLPENAYYATHTMCCVKMEDVIDQIARFMKDTLEIVFVRLTMRKNALVRDVEDMFRAGMKAHGVWETVIPLGSQVAVNLVNSSMSDMIAQNKRLLIVSDQEDHCTVFSPKGMLHSNWMDTDDINVARDKSFQRLSDIAFQRNLEPWTLQGLSWVLTPQSRTVVNGLFSRFNPLGCFTGKPAAPRNIEELARDFNELFPPFYTRYSAAFDKVNYVEWDFATTGASSATTGASGNGADGDTLIQLVITANHIRKSSAK
jgi:hypothetical protein